MKLTSRIRDQLQIELSLPVLFNNRTVAGLAAHAEIGTATAAITALAPRDRAQPHPLSFAQQRMWFLYQMEPDAPTYNVPWAMTLHGKLDLQALQRAVNDLVARHESLRTVFAGTDDGPVQIVTETMAVPVETFDLQAAESSVRDDKLRELAHQPFNLETGPPVRIALLTQSPETNVLLVCMHHVICDVWSFEVLFNELALLYEGYRKNQPAELPALRIHYADYAVWQRDYLKGEELARQIDYWKSTLEGAPPLLQLPLDKPRPAVETHVGRSEFVLLDKRLQDALNSLAQEQHVTLFVLLLSAFDVLLHRYTGENDIVVGTAVSGRQRSELEGVIGFFLNTLAIRSNLSGNPAFTEIVRRNRLQTLDAFRHRDLPFEKLVEELQPVRSLSHAPLFQVLFVLIKQPDNIARFGNLAVSGADLEYEGAKLDLQLTLTETPQGLATSLLYNVDLFEPATVRRMLQHFSALLESIVAAPDTAIDLLPILSAEERKQLLYRWNETRTEYPRDSSIKDVFEAQVRRTPERTAIVCGERTLSYAELNQQANRLAHYLLAQSVQPDTMIGVCMDRSIEALVAIVGIIKAGGAYVPLDPAYPVARLQFMLEDTRAPLVISTSDIEFDTGNVARLDLDRDDLAHQPADDPVSTAVGSNLAYVIYTSGSTGRPKGTLIENRSVLRLVLNTNYFNFDADQRIAMLAPISFDASTLEIWGGLLHGACCVIFPERVPTITALEAFLKVSHIDLLWLTSTLFNTVIDTAPEILGAVGNVMTGGEALSVQHIQKALESLPNTALLNGYGPTESTTFTTTFRIPCRLPDNWRSIPIGRPIANTSVYILNDAMEPAPIGAPGELYIGGDGLSRGYLNLEELTAARFVPNPFDGAENSRLYKTGDLVRYLPDGNIEFISRRDSQIKLRGFRIELGEIDAQLRKSDAVTDVATLLHTSQAGDKRLIAYFVPHTSQVTPDTGELRKFLAARLPAYMIPAVFIPVDFIPLTANGKADRRALPDPDQYLTAPDDSKSLPVTPPQTMLAHTWERLLAVTNIGLDDNFFELGGHSLLTIKLIQEIEKATGERLTIADIFENPTIRELAVLLPDDIGASATTTEEAANTSRLSRWWKYITGSGK
jgi:amino acid adenylation domain-containing protein